MVFGKHGNLVCIKLRLEEGAYYERTQRKLQGKRLGFHDFLTVFFAFVCAFPFQHSYAFRHDQLYHSFNVFYLEGKFTKSAKDSKNTFCSFIIFYSQVIFQKGNHLSNFTANWGPLVFFLFILDYCSPSSVYESYSF